MSVASRGTPGHVDGFGGAMMVQAPAIRSPMLADGARVGPFRILEHIESGGMGEVYRAHDPALERDVALKLITRDVAAEPELRQRFEREARAAGALDHPNIVVVHELGILDGTPFLVMELLQGETLRRRLERGRIDMRRALEIVVQVALGLAAAHAHGLVHCDLKPENVFLTRGGGVKILDFGIAQLRRAEPVPLPSGEVSPIPGGSDLAFGTLGYAAPEQLCGQPVDASADVFSLGAILYELVAGQRAFTGRTPFEVLNAVLHEDPPPLATPGRPVPEALERLVRHCLAKGVEDRLDSAHDVMLELREILKSGAVPEALPNDRHRAGPRVRTWPAWSLAAAALAASAVLAWMQWGPPPPWKPVPLSLELAPPPGTRFALEDLQGPVTLSPDARRAAFVAVEANGRQRLWVRELNAGRARPLPGTDGAHLPFWSPDGRSIGFFANDRLQRIDLDGRRPVALCATTYGRGGAWSRSGTIVFAASHGPLMRVPATGGLPVPFTRLDTAAGEYGHRFPQFLPDGRLLYFVRVARPDPADPRGPLVLQSADGRHRTVLLRTSSNAIHSKGHLLYVEAGELVAHRFDAARARLVGRPRKVAEGVTALRGLQAPVSVSATGVLAYHAAAESRARLVWVDRSGAVRDTLARLGRFDHWSASPDGRSVVAALLDSGGGLSLWRFDHDRPFPRRLTFDDDGLVSSAWWTPDGASLVAASNRSGAWDLYRLDPRDGRSEALFASAQDKFPTGVSADGRYAGFVVRKPADWDLWVLPLAGGARPFPYATGDATEADLAISPDGRRAAFTTIVGGREEVFVGDFPRLAGRVQVSMDGGDRPAWRADGRELAFRDADGWIVATPVLDTPEGPAFRPQRTRVSCTGGFAISRDGARFLVARPEPDPAPRATIVHDWVGLLRSGR